TPMIVVERMLEAAKLKRRDLLYDLGSGDGRIVIKAALTYGVKAEGFELDPKLVEQSRKAAKEAGVTIYCEDEVPVFANERLVAVHMAQGGAKTITLPGACREVRELYTGRTIPVQERKFQYDFATPDTALFELIR
ncbi:MAG: SAM-dependent methyltransferase, partial [Verrucomicrobia bacterium]|nr:SAM-dependent methyltransferase [Verrucomicrobiota bacterium]